MSNQILFKLLEQDTMPRVETRMRVEVGPIICIIVDMFIQGSIAATRFEGADKFVPIAILFHVADFFAVGSARTIHTVVAVIGSGFSRVVESVSAAGGGGGS